MIDLDDDGDCRSLREWCSLNWCSVVQRSITSGNPMTYHDCCLSFSRRTFSKSSGHPKIESLSVLKIASLRGLNNDRAFYDWIVGRLMVHKAMGRPLYFPAINRHHRDENEGSSVLDVVNREFLGKRCKQLEDEVDKAIETISRLRRENRSLLESSQNWHSRYLELLDKLEKEEELNPCTPQKSNRTNYELCFELSYFVCLSASIAFFPALPLILVFVGDPILDSM